MIFFMNMFMMKNEIPKKSFSHSLLPFGLDNNSFKTKFDLAEFHSTSSSSKHRLYLFIVLLLLLTLFPCSSDWVILSTTFPRKVILLSVP